MKKVYTADNPFLTGHIQGLLESCNVECFIKNQNLMGAIGEIPPLECWPEVWIIHDEDYAEAVNIIKSAMPTHTQPPAHWHCTCGETIEGQFSACWSCGSERES